MDTPQCLLPDTRQSAVFSDGPRHLPPYFGPGLCSCWSRRYWSPGDWCWRLSSLQLLVAESRCFPLLRTVTSEAVCSPVSAGWVRHGPCPTVFAYFKLICCAVPRSIECYEAIWTAPVQMRPSENSFAPFTLLAENAINHARSSAFWLSDWGSCSHFCCQTSFDFKIGTICLPSCQSPPYDCSKFSGNYLATS